MISMKPHTGDGAILMVRSREKAGFGGIEEEGKKS
jgi:hypothetical protein